MLLIAVVILLVAVLMLYSSGDSTGSNAGAFDSSGDSTGSSPDAL